MGSDVDFLSDEDEVYDRETVELLLAEIEDLRNSLAQRDAEQFSACETPASVLCARQMSRNRRRCFIGSRSWRKRLTEPTNAS